MGSQRAWCRGEGIEKNGSLSSCLAVSRSSISSIVRSIDKEPWQSQRFSPGRVPNRNAETRSLGSTQTHVRFGDVLADRRPLLLFNVKCSNAAGPLKIESGPRITSNGGFENSLLFLFAPSAAEVTFVWIFVSPPTRLSG